MNEKYLKINQTKNEIERQIETLYNYTATSNGHAISADDEYEKIKADVANLKQKIKTLLQGIEALEAALQTQKIENA